MNMQRYQINRDAFPQEVLRKHDGNWVAFSGDGSRIVANSPTLEEVEQQLAAAGENPEEVGLERIVLENDWQGAELEFE